MAPEPEAERAYPYRAGWRATGCSALFLVVCGAASAALIPAGLERVQDNRMPLGVILLVAGAFGAPMIVLAVVTVVAGILRTVRPPLLRVTPAALLLTADLRGEPERDEDGETKPGAGPPHPVELPLSAIRWVRREGPLNRGSHRLLISHDRAPVALVIEEAMMRPADFDELETALRAAIPAAFAAAPPIATT